VKPARCDRIWELDAYREGRLSGPDALSFERHLRACAECTDRQASDDRLREVAKRLPDAQTPAIDVKRMRRRILNDAAMGLPRQRSRWASVGVAAGVAAAVAGAAGMKHWTGNVPVRGTTPAATQEAAPSLPPATDALAATITPAQGARWSQARDGGYERVRLDDGKVTVHVRPQLANERFVVSVPDGEIEVRGTTFEVTVASGRTTAVRVSDGTVELRLLGFAVRRIGPDEAWPEASAAAPERPAPAAPPASPGPSTTAHRDAPGAPPAATASRSTNNDAETTAYSEAMRLLSSGQNDQAAAALRAFVVAYPGAAEAEDATFLEAVALARAGRADAAGLAAEHHLAAYPSSFHRKEATTLVERAARLRDASASP
jgi:hypothetical protein